jgi:hypothetical protein
LAPSWKEAAPLSFFALKHFWGLDRVGGLALIGCFEREVSLARIGVTCTSEHPDSVTVPLNQQSSLISPPHGISIAKIICFNLVCHENHGSWRLHLDYIRL